MTVAELVRGPDPLNTLEEWEGFTGRDLTQYTRAALQVERSRIRLALLTLDDRPAARNDGRLDWLTARLAQVEARLR